MVKENLLEEPILEPSWKVRDEFSRWTVPVEGKGMAR